MSQFYISSTAAPPPPQVPITFVEDSGSATAAANILNVLANDSNVNNDNGIQTIGSGNTITIQLTNRITGTVTTTDATPTTLVSLALGSTPGVYIVEGDITAFNITDNAGASYTFSGAAITNGATATEIGIENKDIFEQVAMTSADFNLGVTGNTAFIQVIGIAGKTINWSSMFTYRFVS